jgi:hypothetical protein
MAFCSHSWVDSLDFIQGTVEDALCVWPVRHHVIKGRKGLWSKVTQEHTVGRQHIRTAPGQLVRGARRSGQRREQGSGWAGFWHICTSSLCSCLHICWYRTVLITKSYFQTVLRRTTAGGGQGLFPWQGWGHPKCSRSWQVKAAGACTPHLPRAGRGCLSAYFFHFLFSSFFGGTGGWTQDFALAKQVLHCLSHTSSPFCSGYFGDGVSQTICLGWPQTLILSSQSQPPK